jgi:hypothetical protein
MPHNNDIIVIKGNILPSSNGNNEFSHIVACFDQWNALKPNNAHSLRQSAVLRTNT